MTLSTLHGSEIRCDGLVDPTLVPKQLVRLFASAMGLVENVTTWTGSTSEAESAAHILGYIANAPYRLGRSHRPIDIPFSEP